MATLTVTTLDDEAFDSGNLTDETNDGNGLSLREALALAADGDNIEFDASLADGTLTLTEGALTLTQGAHIDGDTDGDGDGDITIDANGAGRVIHFTTGGTSSLHALTITGAQSGVDGGGVTVDSGAGINLTITNSTISSNNANVGGGIWNGGNLTVVNSTIDANTTSTLSGGGGGIYNLGYATLVNVTLANNFATGDGGAINNQGTLTLHHGTLTNNNTILGEAGGIFNGDDLTLSNSIIVNNPEFYGAGGAGYSDLTNDSGATANYVGVNIFSQSYSASMGTITDVETLDVFESGQLADNGGAVQTVALKASDFNLAVDAASGPLPADAQDIDNDANTAEDLPLDARGSGFDRSVDIAGVGSAAPDVGAYEIQADQVEAGSLIVTTLDDVVDSLDGLTSLREAIAFAENGDTITFDAALSGGTIVLAQDSLVLSDNITIDGDIDNDAVADITLDGGGSYRVMELDSGGAITLDGLTLSGGYASDTNGGAGALINYGTTAIFNNVDVTGNSVAGVDDGGGIRVKSGSTLTMYGGSVANNSTASDGGGVAVDATSALSLAGVVISDNSAGEDGGGVSNQGGALSIVNSTISGNMAGDYGGGLHNDGGTADIINATIVGNGAELSGAGIFSTSTIDVSNSTITGNAVGEGGMIGGGVSVFEINLTNSIISGNEQPGGYEVAGTVNLYGGNIIGTDIYSGASDVGDTTLEDIFRDVGANADTGVTSGLLADNGGPVLTVALNLDGDAVDAGDDAFLAAPGLGDPDIQDARGVARVSGDDIDLGAVEMPQTFVVTTIADESAETTNLNDEETDGAGLSLREALALAQDGDTITFDNALSGMTITLAGTQLTISNSITIDGDLDDNGTDDITVDAGGLSRVLEVQGGDEANPEVIAIDGLMITGGYLSGGEGAGVYVGADATVTIQNSNIYSNTIANEGSGGGIYVAGNSTLNIVDSEISQNAAANQGGGVATASSGSTLYISDSEIAHNEAANGGGLYNRGTATITEGSFIYMNDAVNGGGVMSGGNLTVNGGSAIGSNTAATSGGGVFVEGTADFDGAFISGNSSNYRGGGIFNQSGDLTINNTNINNNFAASYGGGVHSNDNSATIISNTTISGNHVNEGSGGGLVFDSVETGSVINSTISGNGLYQSGPGGGAHVTGTAAVDFINTTFYGNFTESGAGGGIAVDSAASVGVYNSTFTGNEASNGSGGAIRGFGGATVNVGNSIFAGNFAEGANNISNNGEASVINNYGGNVFDDSGLSGLDDVNNAGLESIFDSVVVNEFTGFASGELADNGGPVDTVAINAAGVALDGGDNANLPADLFDLDGDMNTAEALPVDARGEDRIQDTRVDAGAFEAVGPQTFTVTTAASAGGEDGFEGGDLAAEMGDGGGLSLAEALGLAQNGDTIQFGAGLAGSVIDTGAENGTLVVTQDNLTIDGDINDDGVADIGLRLTSGGNALTLSGGTELDLQDVEIDGVDFTSNNAGSAVATGANANLTILNSQFSDFQTSALSLGEGSQAQISNVHFYGNSGASGGAIYGNDASVFIENSTFASNQAHSATGGAIDLYGGSLNISNSAFEGNSADNNGGAIRAYRAPTAIANTTFSDNSSAEGSGGAVYIYDARSEFTNTLFAGNAADVVGGAIHARGGEFLYVVNSSFYGNISGFGGGAIRQDAGEAFIYNSTFTGNYSANGGAVQADGGGVYAANTIFSGNGSEGSGLDVDAREGGVFISLGGNIFGQSGLAGASDLYTADTGAVFNETVVNPFTGIASGRLRDNGGPVETVLILRGGLADGAGAAGFLPPDTLDLDADMNTGEDLPVDGRGAARIVGDLDIGAVEILDIVQGTANADVIVGGAFSDEINGLEDGDDIAGNGGADTISGGFGDDTLNGGAGDDTIGGDAGRDSIIGGDGADTLHGFGSHDTLLGGDGNDDLRGGFGRDLIGGSGGNDVLRGFEGEDRLFGGGGNDTLVGNDGDDSLTGGGGVDRLRGDAGDDTLNGRFGDDSVTGGAGDDLFQFRQGHGNDIYDDFTAGAGTDDVIQLVAFGAAFDTFAEVIAAASDNGNHTTIDFGGGDSILLLNVTVADLHEDDFIFT
ncbi:right-handed parallel beta-helix repeat-containing protein [Hyphococcus sp.]|uniref:right-handed parallel beta-helix repeat-containing protein n=1 Tax=Hyphococcus sp. TaxID=2038636 RepID=UPI003CCBCC09